MVASGLTLVALSNLLLMQRCESNAASLVTSHSSKSLLSAPVLCYLVFTLLLKNDRRNSNFQFNRQRTHRLTRENRTIQSLLSFAVVYVQELGDGGE